MLWKCCTQYASKFGKLSNGHRTGKGQFSFKSQRKAMPKIVQTSVQLQARLQQYVNPNFQIFKLDLEKAEAPMIKLLTSFGSQRKQENSRKKKSTSASLTTLKPLTMWITTNCGKSLKRWEYQNISPAIWENCMQAKKKQNWMEQWTGSKLKKEHIKAVYVTLHIQLICRACYVKCHAVWSTSWDQDCWEKYQ